MFPQDLVLFAEGSALSHMFALGLPVIEKIVRPILVYVALVIGLRVFGKRELAQLNPFDLVVLLSLSNTVQNAIIGDDFTVTGGLLGAFSLLSVNYLVVRYLFGHRRLDQLFQGRSTVLIRHGKVDRDALARELLTEHELASVIHRQGFSHFDEIDHCELEPGGVFAVTGKEPAAGDRHYKDLADRLDALTAKIDAIAKAIPAAARSAAEKQAP